MREHQDVQSVTLTYDEMMTFAFLLKVQYPNGFPTLFLRELYKKVNGLCSHEDATFRIEVSRERAPKNE